MWVLTSRTLSDIVSDVVLRSCKKLEMAFDLPCRGWCGLNFTEGPNTQRFLYVGLG